MYKTILFICVIVIFTATLVCAKNWSVRPDGSGSAPTIQAAVDSCATSGDGILILYGTYYEENIVVDGKDIFISYDEGVPYITAPTPGSGTGMTLRNVTGGLTIFGIAFTGFDSGIVVENGSPAIWYTDIQKCGTGIKVSGAASAPDLSHSFIDSCTTGCEVLLCSSMDIKNHTIVNCNTGVFVSGGTVSVSRNIIYGCDTGAQCSGGSVLFDCNDFWLNSSDYGGCAPGPTDFYELPRFCFIAYPEGPYLLHIDSPCWGRNNDCGVSVGAFITIHGCEGTAVKETTWGAIKRMHR